MQCFHAFCRAMLAKERRLLTSLAWSSWRNETHKTLNIDSDPDIERVLLVKSYLDAAAVVLKKESDGWWELGSFVCCGPGSGLVDPFVELRQTVWYGTNDIIVHAGGNQGTGVGERQLLIYRAWRGHLYNVFDIIEQAYNLSGSEETRISFPNTDSSTAPRVITVHRTKETQNRRRTTCVPYRWDASKFTFVPAAPAAKFCRAETASLWRRRTPSRAVGSLSINRFRSRNTNRSSPMV